MDIFYVFVCLVTNLAEMFVYCYCGKMSTESHSAYADYLYETNWTHLPVTLQKYYILMLSNSQPAIHYHGFGLMYLNLESFLKVCEFEYLSGCKRKFEEFIYAIYSDAESGLHLLYGISSCHR